MLRHLRIEELALIELVELDFEPGFTVVTGETGAGKSLLLDALDLLLGGRADAEMVRTGSAKARVDSEWDVTDLPLVLEWLKAHQLEDESAPGLMLVRREVTATGRSRGAINGRAVPAGLLADLGRLLADRHQQGDQQGLLSPACQRDLFDAHAGAGALREEVAACWRRVTELGAAIAELERRERDALQKREFLEFQAGELRALKLREGELAELEARRDRLAHAEELGRQAATVLTALRDADTGSAVDAAGSARRLLERMAAHDPSMRTHAEQVAQAIALLADVAASLDGYGDSLDADPAELGRVAERIDQLKRALRKHGPAEADALAKLARIEADLAVMEGASDERSRLEMQRTEQARAFAAACRALTARRRAHAEPFAAAMAGILRDLSMPHARVELRFEAPENGTAAGPDGAESVVIHFSANEGEPVRPLAKVASGGELSRAMLALRVLSANRADVPLMVFDEVDAGLSGRAAARVGARLAELGRHRQVLCVTHSAPVAACASHHLVVTKKSTGERTVASVASVRGSHRQAEVARLLDGAGETAASRKLAEELLRRAQSAAGAVADLDLGVVAREA